MDVQRDMHWKVNTKKNRRSAESKQESFFYRSRPLRTIGYRCEHEWLGAHLGLGCEPSEDNPNRALFINSSKRCWKAASSAIKSSSDPTKKSIVWLSCLNYAATCCCRKHPMCLKTLSLKLSLDNICCHCLFYEN